MSYYPLNSHGLSSLVSLLLAYKYHLLIPLAIVEGPIVSVLGGFFVTLGIFNPFVVYAIIVAGDLVGDTLYYSIGRFGAHFLFVRFGHFLKITPEKMADAKQYFHKHRNKTIIFAKLIHGIGFTGLVVAGTLKISYWRYILICFLTTLLQAAVFLIIGILFGHAYVQINNYLNYFAASTFVLALAIVLILLFRKWKINPKP